MDKYPKTESRLISEIQICNREEYHNLMTANIIIAANEGSKMDFEFKT